ncbi:MAG: hypothetical protein MRZ79_04980 [Bacteroidia bacterium]|nr:hypothetical protein [Bacteroidia bacterium]
MTRSILFLLPPLLLMFSCATPYENSEKKTVDSKVLSFSKKIEAAHNLSGWNEKQALSFDFQLFFGGQERLNAKILMEPDFGRISIKTKDGAEMYYLEDKTYLFPEDAAYKNPRFDVLTWPYFLAVPFKLNDPGTQLASHDSLPLNGKKYQVEKLSFSAGTGDAPDDWYKVFKDPETDLLKALVYIVTYSRSQEDAEKNPHAIVYDEFREIGGVTIPTKWAFRNWKDGEFGDKIGEADLSNLAFIIPDENTFKLPEGAILKEK